MKKNDFLLTADELSHQKMEYLETLFALGNGQIGVRAGHPLKVNQLYPGNPGAFVNGFFDSMANGLMGMQKNIKRFANCQTCVELF